MRFGKYLENLFSEDVDVSRVHCVRCEQKDLEHNLLKSETIYKGKKYWYTWDYNNGIVIARYCEVK